MVDINNSCLTLESSLGDEKVYHNYYLWVPYMLAFQVITYTFKSTSSTIITIAIILIIIFYLNHPGGLLLLTLDTITIIILTRMVLSIIFIQSLQAACFYVPHWIWKQLEGGRLQNIVQGLNEVPPKSN